MKAGLGRTEAGRRTGPQEHSVKAPDAEMKMYGKVLSQDQSRVLPGPKEATISR